MSVPAEVAKPQTTLQIIKAYVESEAVKKRFSEVLGKKAPQFLASISSLVASQTNFTGCDPNTIMASAMVAATLDLPINPNLGFAYIIPYNSRNGKQAQFQMGYKGFIQLALRSGQFQTINATEVYEGEIVGLNRLTGELTLDQDKRKSDEVVGYAAYFRLINGFEKTLYMSVEQITKHAETFSKSYDNPAGIWKKDFHSMALKTVLKLLLSKYGILSVDMQKAIEVDQAVMKDDGAAEYVDATTVEEPSVQDDVAAKAKAALAKQKPGNGASPADDLKAKGQKRVDGWMSSISHAKTRDDLVKITKEVEKVKDAGELLDEQYATVLTAIDEKDVELQGAK